MLEIACKQEFDSLPTAFQIMSPKTIQIKLLRSQ